MDQRRATQGPLRHHFVYHLLTPKKFCFLTYLCVPQGRSLLDIINKEKTNPKYLPGNIQIGAKQGEDQSQVSVQ